MRWRVAGSIPIAIFLAIGLFVPSANAKGPTGGGGKTAGGDVRSKAFAFTPTELTNYPFAEPSIEVFDNYHVIFCGPGGDSGNYFGRTADWKNFSLISITDPVIGGGDCDIKIGPTGTLYEADLQLFGSALRRSFDEGQTWGTADYYEEPIEEDRQWLAPDPHNSKVVYFVYHDLTLEAEIMAKSLDGGVTYPIHSIVSTDPTLGTDTFPNTFSGPIVVDPSDSSRVYVAYGISNLQRNLDPAFAPFGLPLQVVVGVSDDGGLTWTDHVAMTSSGDSVLGNLFPWITVDQGGNVYAGAAGHVVNADGSAKNGMFIASSTDHGTTWTDPIHVGTSTTGAGVFPTVAAGKAGVLDVAWIQSDREDFSDPARCGPSGSLRAAMPRHPRRRSRRPSGRSSVMGPCASWGSCATETGTCSISWGWSSTSSATRTSRWPAPRAVPTAVRTSSTGGRMPALRQPASRASRRASRHGPDRRRAFRLRA